MGLINSERKKNDGIAFFGTSAKKVKTIIKYCFRIIR